MSNLIKSDENNTLIPNSKIRVFEHNYIDKTRKSISIDEVIISDVGDKIFWIDGCNLKAEFFERFEINEDAVLSLEQDAVSDVVKYGDLFRFDLIHISFGEWVESHKLKTQKIRCLLGPRLFITSCDRSDLTDCLVKGYVTDFWAASKGAIFLVYEMYHHILDSYLRIHHVMQNKLKLTNERVMMSDESIIKDALSLHTDLLTFREVAHSSRNTLNFLANRAVLFISANTRPYLDNMSMVLERLDEDLTVDRQIISDSVSFYVSIVSYKMNVSIKAMTAVNVIFVPLTLLAAVYGMNFLSMPEYKWRYGYLFFWILFFITLGVSLWWLKRKERIKIAGPIKESNVKK